MEQWEADSIARKLATSWPRSSISADAWSDELLPLTKGPAEEATRRLVRTSEHAPTIAAFIGQYRALLGTAPAGGDACHECAGTGLVTDTRHPQHWPGDPTSVPVMLDADGKPDPKECACNVVTACGCRVGQSDGRRTLAFVRGELNRNAA